MSDVARVQGRAGTHKACWLITTFESTLRSEVTTAAQVSSAEDSSARTVKARAYAGGKERATDERRTGESRRGAACCIGGAEKDRGVVAKL